MENRLLNVTSDNLGKRISMSIDNLRWTLELLLQGKKALLSSRYQYP